VKFIRSKNTWRIVESFSGTTGCLEQLALSKGYRVGDICEALGCSQRGLYSIFLRDIGLPPKHWLDLERMVVARRKLEGGRAIKEVAEELGYASMIGFSRRFERVYGLPPGRFLRHRQVFDPTTHRDGDESLRDG
jgi:AraC-like DNA-binding protein